MKFGNPQGVTQRDKVLTSPIPLRSKSGLMNKKKVFFRQNRSRGPTTEGLNFNSHNYTIDGTETHKIEDLLDRKYGQKERKIGFLNYRIFSVPYKGCASTLNCAGLYRLFRSKKYIVFSHQSHGLKFSEF